MSQYSNTNSGSAMRSNAPLQSWSQPSIKPAGKPEMPANTCHSTSTSKGSGGTKVVAETGTFAHPTTTPFPQNGGHESKPESPWDEGTVYGRLVDLTQNATRTLVGSPYDRIPAYCIRAARAIDEFERVFDSPPK